MTDIDMERLEYFRDRYHALVVIDYKVADDNHTGSLLSLDDVIKRLNKVTVENEQLKKEFDKLKHRHGLLHDVCIEAECDRDGYHKDVVYLEKENEQLKETIKNVYDLLAEEVDIFSDKATEHDICAYVELKEFDNKDAYYMAVSTKKAIKMLKECFDD